jgi:hypothetical protein
MKTFFETLRIAFILGVCSYGLFVVLAISTPKSPISSGIEQ